MKINERGFSYFWEYFMLYLWREYKKGNISCRELRQLFGFLG